MGKKSGTNRRGQGLTEYIIIVGAWDAPVISIIY